jgi:hypothetical protein
METNMHRSTFVIVVASLALLMTQLQAQDFILDDVMSRDDQRKTGVSTLTIGQKLALESWLNKNFVLKPKEQTPQPQPELSLSINIDNGQKLRLSDNSLWEIAPNDVQTAAVWITPFPVQIKSSGDPDYPCLLVNLNSGMSVKARPIPATPS